MSSEGGHTHSVLQGEIGNRSDKGRCPNLFHSTDINTVRIFHSSLLPPKKGVLLLQCTLSILNHCRHAQFFHTEPFCGVLWCFNTPVAWNNLSWKVSGRTAESGLCSDSKCFAMTVSQLKLSYSHQKLLRYTNGQYRRSLGNPGTFKNTWKM